jgi:hypothetical protein
MSIGNNANSGDKNVIKKEAKIIFKYEGLTIGKELCGMQTQN